MTPESSDFLRQEMGVPGPEIVVVSGLEKFDTTRPNAARIYDYWLGGKDNFTADRAAAEQVAQLAPWVVCGARANRAFLARAVRFLAQAGIRQYVDIGCGLPTSGNVHEVAQAVDPACRTVYVDSDTIVLIHARALLAGDHRTIAVDGDARDPDGIFNNPTVRAHLDLDQPVAVLLTALLHFLDGDEPARIVAAVRDRLAPGSYVVISHASDLPDTTGPPDQAAATRAAAGQATATQADGQTAVGRTAATRAAAELYETLAGPFTLRTREQVTALFDGFDLVEPGVVPAHLWRPDRGPSGAAIPVLAGIGRLPDSDSQSGSHPVCDHSSSSDSVSAFDSCPGPGPAPVRGPGGPGVPGKDRVRVRG